jgi:uncharacterized tellurite resistance protein B-like protein
MLAKLFRSYGLAAEDARHAVVDRYTRIFHRDADRDARDFGIDTKKFAAAAVFCEILVADGHLHDRETARCKELIALRFGLTPEQADDVFSAAAEVMADGAELGPMTASVRDHFDYDERVELVEMLFDMTHADDTVQDSEVAMAEQAGAAMGVRGADIARARAKIENRVKSLAGDAVPKQAGI